MQNSEWGRLALTGFGAGILGAVLGAMWTGSRAAPGATPPTVDMAPVEAAIRELREVLDRRPVAAAEGHARIATPERPPIREVVDAHPASAELHAPALESRLDRFAAALDAAVERLEKLADSDRRSAQLAEMTESMARVPRTPTQWPEVQRLVGLGDAVSPELAFLTPQEVAQRLGFPTGVQTDHGEQKVVWDYSIPGQEDGLHVEFFAGRVSSCGAW